MHMVRGELREAAVPQFANHHSLVAQAAAGVGSELIEALAAVLRRILVGVVGLLLQLLLRRLELLVLLRVVRLMLLLSLLLLLMMMLLLLLLLLIIKS